MLLSGSCISEKLKETLGPSPPVLGAAFLQIIHSRRDADAAWEIILWGERQGEDKQALGFSFIKSCGSQDSREPTGHTTLRTGSNFTAGANFQTAVHTGGICGYMTQIVRTAVNKQLANTAVQRGALQTAKTHAGGRWSSPAPPCHLCHVGHRAPPGPALSGHVHSSAASLRGAAHRRARTQTPRAWALQPGLRAFIMTSHDKQKRSDSSLTTVTPLKTRRLQYGDASDFPVM